MTSLASLSSILDQAGAQLGGFLPRLAGALLLLVVGLLVARLAARVLRKGLERIGLDAAAERFGTGDVLAKAGLGDSLSHLLVIGVRVAIVVVTVFAALSLLGLQFLSDSLNQGVLLLPKLAVAGALLLAGAVAGGLARDRVDKVGREMDVGVPLGRVAQITVFAAFAITAASQVAVSTALLMVLVGILLASACATVALAFGIGGQHVAREFSAGRYVRSTYAVGSEVSFDGVRGEVVAVETTSTVLRTPSGDTLHVPNHALLAAYVTVHAEPEGGPLE